MTRDMKIKNMKTIRYDKNKKWYQKMITIINENERYDIQRLLVGGHEKLIDLHV